MFSILSIINPNFSYSEVSSIDAFGQSVHTITKANCIGCHGSGVRPFHANPDVKTAHDAVVNNGLADLVTFANSKLYLKVKSGHHCWTNNCANDSLLMLNQITNWKKLTQPGTTTPNVPTTPTTPTTPIPPVTPSAEVQLKNKTIAYKLFNRLAGVPPVKSVLNEVVALVAAKKTKEAALRVMDEPSFYNITLKNWVKPWTNADRTNRAPLNDYVATVLGIVRDNIPFDQVIYGDHLYIAGAGTPGTIPNYDKKSNAHYQRLEDTGANLKDYLVRVSQSKVTGIKDTAGVLTTRASGAAYFSAGTNRRATRFAFINFMCRDLEALHDINIPDYHVRKDVERNPGGDSRTYRNKCVGCHAGQDAIGGAFAYFDFVNGETVYTEGKVVDKINKTVSFLEGWSTKDDSWINTWAEGQNSNLGWPAKSSGTGVRELGVMLSRSRAFAECMSSKVYELVCLRTPTEEVDKREMRRLADIFQQDANFNMKNLMAETALSCVGE